MDIKKHFIWLTFALFLILFAIFGNKILIHDSAEYITIAKNFAGINNVDIFTAHSLLYPLIISPFVKIWPSMITIKMINCFWLLLIGLVFLFGLKDKRAFIIFAFSPLVWAVSIETTPVLPTTFFFFLGWLFFKNENIKYNYLWAGILIGLSCAVYDVLLLVTLIFLLVYFIDRKLSSFITFLTFVFIGFLPRLILDMWIFHMPFYSLIRFFGANLIVSIGLNPGTTNTQLFSNLYALIIIIAVSPLLFKLYRFNFKDNKKDLAFLLISAVLLLVRAAMLKYFLILAPIAILFLAKTLSDKEIKWHCILSIAIIVFLTAGYFTYTADKQIEKDLNNIIKDYSNVSQIIAGPYEANGFASFIWTSAPRIYWYEDFQASLKNQTSMKSYNFKFNSKIPLREDISFSASFNRPENRTYENYIIVTEKNTNMSNFNLEKCYETLCVYSI